MLASTRGFDGRVQREQVGLFGNGANGIQDSVDVAAVLLEFLHRMSRAQEVLAQLRDATCRLVDLKLPVVNLTLARVSRGGRFAARACDLVGRRYHLVERCRNKLDCAALAFCSVIHIGGHARGTVGGAAQCRRGAADALYQVANCAKELIEPAREHRRFVLASYLKAASEIAFALGDAFQATGHAADWANDQACEGSADHGKCDGQYGCNDGDLQGQAVGAGHDFIALDQADELPAELL